MSDAVELKFIENDANFRIEFAPGFRDDIQMEFASGFEEGLDVVFENVGKDGKDGGYYVPSVTDDGVLSWTPSRANMTAAPSANVKGPPGVAPKIQNGTWWVWDDAVGGYVDTGVLAGGGEGGVSFKIGHGLKIENEELMVNSVNDFEGDNSLPITAAAVQATVGNIEVLLATI